MSMPPGSLEDLVGLPAQLVCLCAFGLKTWPRLSAGQKNSWRMSAGVLKGVDARHEKEQCYSITLEAESSAVFEHATASAREAKTAKERRRLYDAAFKREDFSKAEMLVAVAERAAIAHLEGYRLIAVAPDLTVAKATALLGRVFSDVESRFGTRKPRARCDDWLPLITVFEAAALKIGFGVSQAFARYRRVQDALTFGPRVRVNDLRAMTNGDALKGPRLEVKVIPGGPCWSVAVPDLRAGGKCRR